MASDPADVTYTLTRDKDKDEGKSDTSTHRIAQLYVRSRYLDFHRNPSRTRRRMLNTEAPVLAPSTPQSQRRTAHALLLARYTALGLLDSIHALTDDVGTRRPRMLRSSKRRRRRKQEINPNAVGGVVQNGHVQEPKHVRGCPEVGVMLRERVHASSSVRSISVVAAGSRRAVSPLCQDRLVPARRIADEHDGHASRW